MECQVIQKHRPEKVKIVAIYVVFGLTWIYGSDIALGWLLHDSELLIKVAVIKGFLFIFCTAVLLYMLISRFVRLLAVAERTEWKRTEEELKESEERFKALHNASFGGIAIHDKGLILECNQGLAEITGYTVEELIGMDGLLLIAPGSRALIMHKIVTGYEKPYEAVGIRKNAEEFPLRLESRNVPYKGKNVRTTEFRDITEYKEYEAEQERMQRQLEQSQKMESVGRLAGGVAHDFNNMLGVILGYSEIILDQVEESQPIYSALQGIQQAARRSADLTRQLLAFARKQTVAPKVLDLNDTVEGNSLVLSESDTQTVVKHACYGW